MTVDQRIEDPVDQFPIGMRVLAVDDDPTCLKLLETLLRRCQYNVTTTSQARTALNMLRENQNKFDLVISDVHMPDMDGFKLLELVGLEMDLPVIMLSANGDRKLVMKGISHGACDYLLKPVRIEELKNIWQHVIRRKKFDSKTQRSSRNSGSAENGGDGDPELGGTGNSEQKVTKKRKDQDEDDDDDRDENGDDCNDDPSTQKKPRVVWSVDLHRKFVAAVNQLGIDKAVPKKILDLMNVEKLTRENVASHLQKYRLYLKRISCVANQQASMVAAFGTTDPSYMRMNSINGPGNFNPLSMSVQFQNQSYRQFPSTGIIGRLNSPANMGLRLPSSGGIVQIGNNSNNSHNPSNPNDQIKFHDPTMLQGIPMPFELGQSQQQQQQVEDFDNWSTPAQSSCFQSSSYPLSDRFKQTGLSSTGSRDSVVGLRVAGSCYDGSSVSPLSIHSHHRSISDSAQCQVSSWENVRPSHNVMPSSSLNPLMPAVDHSLDTGNTMFQRDVDFNSSAVQPNFGEPSMVRFEEVERSIMESKLRQEYVLTNQNRPPQGSYMGNQFGALGDIVNCSIKQEHNKAEGEYDSFSIGNGNLL